VSAVIGASHVLCSIGSGTDQVWAAARAGIGRIVNSDVMDRYIDPIQMALVPEDSLPPLNAEIDDLPLPPRARRMLRLATPALQTVSQDLDGPVPIVIGLPELQLSEAPWLVHMPAYLQKMTGAPIDRARSTVVPHGRAAGVMALELALNTLQSEPTATVIVGGVDTYLDLLLLGNLDREQRILGQRVMDGFIPGEGAAFFVLSGEVASGPRVIVNGVASTMDEGHRYGTAAAKGEGLAVALTLLRQRVGELSGPIGTTFAGFNGENFDAKLWGVAFTRHNDFFSPAMMLEHPADRYGDVGAATGAILLAMAAKSLASGIRQGPALVWAASDREPRACAVVSMASS
jgi:3-oxoacyl-[acyl-carrier-protein] synthase-1